MPVSPAYAEGLTEEVVDVYAAAELRLLERIGKSLAEGFDAPAWAERKLLEIQLMSASMAGILDTASGEASEALARDLAQAYNRGKAGAQADLAELVVRGVQGIATGSSGLPAIRRLVGETVDQLQSTHAAVLRTVADEYRAAVRITTGGILTGTQTRRQATQDALNQLADKGISGFTDKRGRRWALESYVEMASRTAAGRASVDGHTDRLQEAGQDLVVVSDAPQECKLCRPFEGKVLSISGNITAAAGVTVSGTLDAARRAGLFHPNCRHSTALYQPGRTKLPTRTEDPQGDADRQELRKLERQVRAARRREAVALDPLAARKAQADVRAGQARIRDHVANSTAKRQPQRERLTQPGPVKPDPPFRKLSDDDLQAKLDAEFASGGENMDLIERVSIEQELRERYAGSPASEQFRRRNTMLDEDFRGTADDELQQQIDDALDSGDPDAHQFIDAAFEELKRRRYAGKGVALPKPKGGVYRGESKTARLARLRTEWSDNLYRESLDLEEATNGVLIRRDRLAEFREKHGAGNAMRVLLEGDPNTAYYYASEEVRRYWEATPNTRLTFAEYAEASGVTDDRVREAAAKARKRKQDAATRAERRTI